MSAGSAPVLFTSSINAFHKLIRFFTIIHLTFNLYFSAILPAAINQNGISESGMYSPPSDAVCCPCP